MINNHQKITIVWNMTYGCNYNCTECFQIADKTKHPQKQIVTKIILALAEKFKGQGCELKLTGGEIFSYPNFIDDVVNLITNKTKFDITITTNFSYPNSEYLKFSKVTKDRLKRISISWHNNYMSADYFYKKIIKFREMLDKIGMRNLIIKVNLILIPDNFENIEKIVKNLKNRENIILHFQVFRVGRYGRKFYKYSDREVNFINKLIKDKTPLGYNNKRHYQGMKCRAGLDYFVVNPDGDVFTCHEAYELGSNGKYSLGNLVDGTFEVKTKPFYCPFDYCSVPTVALENIVEYK